MRDAMRYGEDEVYRECKEALIRREKKPSERYLEWKADFVSSLEKSWAQTTKMRYPRIKQHAG